MTRRLNRFSAQLPIYNLDTDEEGKCCPLNGDDAMHLSNDDFVPAHNF